MALININVAWRRLDTVCINDNGIIKEVDVYGNYENVIHLFDFNQEYTGAPVHVWMIFADDRQGLNASFDGEGRSWFGVSSGHTVPLESLDQITDYSIFQWQDNKGKDAIVEDNGDGTITIGDVTIADPTQAVNDVNALDNQINAIGTGLEARFNQLHTQVQSIDAAEGGAALSQAVTDAQAAATIAEQMKEDALLAALDAEAAKDAAATHASTADGHAQAALVAKSDAEESAGKAETSASAAVVAETNSQGHAAAALVAETNAKASETTSENNAIAAIAAKTDAQGHATSALNAKTDAETAQSNASSFASTAEGHASAAQTAETNADGHKNSASTFATAAQNSAQSAQTAETNAEGHKNSASSSATAASDSAQAAQAAESNSETHKNTASSSATASANSATAAQTAKTEAEGFKNQAATYAQTSQDKAELASFLSMSNGGIVNLNTKQQFSDSYAGDNLPDAGSHIADVTDGIQITGGRWVYGKTPIAVDVNKKYLVRARFRVTQNSTDASKRKFYCGVVTLDEHLANLTGGAGTHRYCTLSGVDYATANGVVEVSGYIQGVGDDRTNFRSGTKFIRPLLISNYSGGDGVTILESLHFEDVTEVNAVSSELSLVKDDMVNVKATYTLKMNANGIFAGMGLIADSATQNSKVYFAVDEFVLVPSNATSTSVADSPFYFSGNQLFVDNAHIKNLTSQNINVAELFAQNITASGTITGLKFQTSSSSSVDRTVIDDDTLKHFPAGQSTPTFTLGNDFNEGSVVQIGYLGYAGQAVNAVGNINLSLIYATNGSSNTNGHGIKGDAYFGVGVVGSSGNGYGGQFTSGTKEALYLSTLSNKAPMIVTSSYKVTNLNADLLDGYHANTGNVVNTVAVRNSSGDINARLFRASYGNQTTISGAIAFRVNNSSDNYTRYCSSNSAVRSWLDVYSKSEVLNLYKGDNVKQYFGAGSDVAHFWSGSHYYTDINGGGDWYIRDANSSYAWRFLFKTDEGDFEASRNILANGGRFLSDGSAWIGSHEGSASGTMYLRPNGENSSTGELKLTTGGVLTVAGQEIAKKSEVPSVSQQGGGSTSGYYRRDPDSGFVQQWGKKTVTGNSTTTVTLPYNMGNTYYNVQLTFIENNNNDKYTAKIGIVASSYFTIRTTHSGSWTIHWLVTGLT